MIDSENVIRELKNLGAWHTHHYAPFHYEAAETIHNAVVLLREQEPITIHDPGAICPNCKWPLYPEDHPNYCGNCGRRIKWD